MSEPGPKLFLYWFAYYGLDSPSVRYRGYYPLRFLAEKHGVKSMLVVPGYRPDRIVHFVRAYFSALFLPKPGAWAVVQRVHSNRIYSALLKILVRWGKVPVLYDLDDADYLEHPPRNIYYFMKHCTAVCVGSEALVRVARRYNDRVFLNTSPTMDLGIRKKKRNPVLHIGWIGCFGGGHKEGMVRYFFPALEQLDFPVKLTLLGVNKPEERHGLEEHFKNLKNVELLLPGDINWLDEAEVQTRIAEFDVGVATLLNNELHISKSAFKLKQYLNNGVPVLSSDLPENHRFVDDGENGYLCRTADDFRDGLLQIRRLSDEAYATLAENAVKSSHRFGLEAYAQNLLAFSGNRELPVTVPETGA